MEDLFSLSGIPALIGWAALLASPLIPRLSQWVAGIISPALLSIAYSALIMGFWSRAQGGFGSLADVQLLFQTPQILLAGWVHYLAFDLFVGAWIVRTARNEGLHFALVVPLLPLTFLFGPAGFLAFTLIRAARGTLKPSI
ncbi:MAG: ABA4-like family protein [Notoacmeibacter sp.]